MTLTIDFNNGAHCFLLGVALIIVLLIGIAGGNDSDTSFVTAICVLLFVGLVLYGVVRMCQTLL